jgi:hypothetical protein
VTGSYLDVLYVTFLFTSLQGMRESRRAVALNELSPEAISDPD